MKYIRQFLIIMFITFIGELLNQLIPLPVPASIYGLFILFFSLLSGIIRLEQVKETGKFLVAIMPIMFLPAGVGVMNIWEDLVPILFPVTVIVVFTTVIVMAAAGYAAQLTVRRDKRKMMRKAGNMNHE